MKNSTGMAEALGKVFKNRKALTINTVVTGHQSISTYYDLLEYYSSGNTEITINDRNEISYVLSLVKQAT